MDVTREIVAQSVDSILVDDGEWVYHVADGFRHFFASHGDESVDDYLLCRRKSRRHEHRLPHGCLLAYLVFSRHLQSVWLLYRAPELLEISLVAGPSERRDVVDKRVEPYVHDVLLVARYCDTPGHLGAEARY